MSAKRFGGKFSPGKTPARPAQSGGSGGDAPAPPPAPAPSRIRARPAAPFDLRASLMFVFPTPLLLAAFGAMSDGAPIRLTVLLFAYASLLLGAWLLREGRKAQAAYDEREIARPPAFPRKLCAAGLAGVGVLAATWVSSSPGGILAFTSQIVTGVIFGILTAGAHVLAFGIDPLRPKGLTSNIAQYELERVTDALDKAEAKLQSIEKLAHKLHKVTRLNAEVRDMIKMVEQDPRDLSRARRYLGVYLKGAEDATRKYSDNHERLNDPKLRQDYLDLLGDLEGSFSRGKETLLLDDRTDLEVEIEVLRERLDQEGA